VSDLPAFEMNRQGQREFGRLCERHEAARKELGWKLGLLGERRAGEQGWECVDCREARLTRTVLDSLIAADDTAARAREIMESVRVLPGQLGIFGVEK
jgi:hypothetical protein